jgi:hypothetical protein
MTGGQLTPGPKIGRWLTGGSGEPPRAVGVDAVERAVAV